MHAQVFDWCLERSCCVVGQLAISAVKKRLEFSVLAGLELRIKFSGVLVCMTYRPGCVEGMSLFGHVVSIKVFVWLLK